MNANFSECMSNPIAYLQPSNARSSGARNAKTEATEIFVTMMNASHCVISCGNEPNDNKLSTGNDVDVTAQMNDIHTSGSYKKPIAEAKSEEESFNDKLEDKSEILEEFEENITKEVADILEVDEEQVVEAMETLGLTVFDLLDPQNLADLTMELGDFSDASELLLNPEYMQLLQMAGEAATELMNDLQIPMSELAETLPKLDSFMMQMKEAQTAEDEVIVTQKDETVETAGLSEQTVVVQGIAEEAVDTVDDDSDQGENVFHSDEELMASILKDIEEAGDELVEEVNWEEQLDEEDLVGSLPLEDGDVDEYDPESEAFQAQFDEFVRNVKKERGLSEQTMEQGEHNPQQMMNQFVTRQVEQVVNAVESYVSIDTFDLMEQVVEKMKLCVTEKITSLEMQLNPEHLGKIHMQVSSEEGEISAKLFAANEAVKVALESQLSTLLEEMRQSGMKVNAIEITVASHEFERNLEQGQQEEQKREEEANESYNRRRNINLSSLDELTGLMSEEETLVAQIMKDNGNSVDLSA